MAVNKGLHSCNPVCMVFVFRKCCSVLRWNLCVLQALDTRICLALSSFIRVLDDNLPVSVRPWLSEHMTPVTPGLVILEVQVDKSILLQCHPLNV